jgi:hypothetical protein
MHGSLSIAGSVLYVARHAGSAEVRAYDLDGASLGTGFRIPASGGARARAAGLAADADHRLWIADAGARAVRAFTVFGTELPAWKANGSDADEAGQIGVPIAIALDGVEDETRLLVASQGERRHALQVFEKNGALVASLRARGDRDRRFQRVERASLRGRFVHACEAGSGFVQVFRDGEFHAMFQPPRARGEPGAPRAVVALHDRRLVVATGGARGSGLHLCEADGRPIRTLAPAGEDGGEVLEPSDVAIVEGSSDHRTRVFAIDQDGDRVQVFTLEGVCYGSIADLPRATP